MNKHAGDEQNEKKALTLVKKGQKEAFRYVVEKYKKQAYFIALSLVRNQEDALDLSQEAFIKAFRKIKRYDPEKEFFPWFYSLLKNICLDFLRRKKRRAEVSLESVLLFSEDDVDRGLESKLWEAVDSLPFEQKEIIILRYFQQFSYQEIAELTGKPIGSIMSSLYNAKKKLQKALS